MILQGSTFEKLQKTERTLPPTLSKKYFLFLLSFFLVRAGFLSSCFLFFFSFSFFLGDLVALFLWGGF